MHVYIKNQFEGFHRWKTAPDEVSFLRDRHRHIFKVKTTIEVEFADRDVEFIMVQHEINDIIKEMVAGDMLDWSCETMAIYILEHLHQLHPNREMSCDVSEDGENGAVVSVSKSGKIY